MWIGRNIDRLLTLGGTVTSFGILVDPVGALPALGLGAVTGYAAFRGCDALVKKAANGKWSIRQHAQTTRVLDGIENVVRGVLVDRRVYDETHTGRIVAVKDGGRVLIRCQIPRGLAPSSIETHAEAIATALRAHAVRPTGRERGWVIFELFAHDGLVSGTELSPDVLATGQTNVTDGISIGRDEVSRAVTMALYAQTVLVGGSPGSGKSALSWSLLGHAVLDPRAIVVILDLKPYGIETAPIHDRADYVATDSDEAAKVLRRVWLEVDRRNKVLHERMADKANPNDPDMPPIIIGCDEAAELTRDGSDEGKEALKYLTRIVAVGRASGIGVLLVTQKPDSTVIPTALRDLMAQRICLRVGTRAQAETILGPIPEGVRPWEIGTDQPGRGYAIDATGTGRLFQAAFIDREAVIEMGQQAAKNRQNTGGNRFELPELPPDPVPETEGADSQSGEGRQAPKRRRRKRDTQK